MNLPRQNINFSSGVRNNDINSSKQSLNRNALGGGYMAERGRGSMAPSKAFLYNKQARNASSDSKSYLNNFKGVGSVNSSATKLDRNGNMIPATVLQHNLNKKLPSPGRRQQEEQKRANSVASGDTIISTASSNSPIKRSLQMKKNLQLNGLAISSNVSTNNQNNRRRVNY